MAGISYRITVDSAEAQAAFSGLQRSGEEAARGIERAFSSLTSSGGFGTLATAITAATAAVAAFAGGLFAMAQSSAESVNELARLATQTQSTTEEMSGMVGALAQFGAETDKISRAFRQAATIIEQQWPAAQKSVRDAAGKMTADLLSIQKATLDLDKAQQDAANHGKQAAAQQVQNTQSVASASLSLAQAQLALQELETGERDVAAQQELAARQAQLRVQQAQLQLAQAVRKEEEDRAAAARAAEEAELRVAQAELQRAEATKKANETAANSIENLTQFINALASGASTAGIQVNASIDNMIKGIIASVGPGAAALKEFKGGLGEIGAQAPALRPVILKLADVFANLKDETLKMAIAQKLFTGELAVGMVDALSRGSRALQEEENRVRALGLTFSETDKTISRDFRQSFERLSFAIKTVATQLGLLFQPAFSAAMKVLADNVERGRERILAFGAAIRDRVVPILETFIRVLLGVPQAGTDDWLVRYIENIQTFGRAVGTVITGFVIPAFRALLAVADTIASGLNAVFRTNLNAIEILIGAWVAKVLGLFGAVRAVIGVLGAALLGFAEGLAAAFSTGGMAAVAGVLATILRRVIAIALALETAIALFRDFTATGGRVGELERQMDALTKQFQQGQLTADQYRAKLADLQRQFAETGQVGGGTQATGFLDQFKRSLDETDAKVKQLLGDTQQAAPQIGSALQQGGTGAKQIAVGAQQATSAIKDLEGGVDSLAVKVTNLPNFGKVLQIPPDPLRQAADILSVVETSIRGVQQAAAIITFPTTVTEEALRLQGVIQQDIQAVQQLTGAFQPLADTSPITAQSSALQSLIPIIDNLIQRYRALAEAAAAFSRATVGSPAVGESVGEFDRGGYTGPGSIRKVAGFVHAQEYVQPANVVRQPGVLPFMEYLRRTGGDLQRAIEAFVGRGHLLGGYVGNLARSLDVRVLPGFQSGGTVPAPVGAGLHPVTIQIAGGPTLGGLHATSSVVEELRKEAALSQIRSGGRKPSRYT